MLCIFVKILHEQVTNCLMEKNKSVELFHKSFCNKKVCSRTKKITLWAYAQGPKKLSYECTYAQGPKKWPFECMLNRCLSVHSMAVWVYAQGPKKWPFEHTLKDTLSLYMFTCQIEQNCFRPPNFIVFQLRLVWFLDNSCILKIPFAPFWITSLSLCLHLCVLLLLLKKLSITVLRLLSFRLYVILQYFVTNFRVLFPGL